MVQLPNLFYLISVYVQPFKVSGGGCFGRVQVRVVNRARAFRVGSGLGRAWTLKNY